MSILSDEELASMRATVDTTLTDSCTIGTRSAPSFNSGTGQYAASSITPVYTGPCRIGVAAALGSDAEAGGEAFRLLVYKIRLPWDTEDIAVGHILAITASNDPALEGRELQVTDVRGMTDPLSRSLMAEEADG